MRDVACAGYVAGCNTRWFATPTEGGAMSMEAAQDNLQARLSFANDDTDRYASMLAFPCYEGQFNSGQLDTVLSVTTRLLPWEVTSPSSDQKSYFPGGKAGWDYYKGIYQLEQLHYGEDVRAAESQEFIAQGSVNNALCFVGPHRVYSPWSATYQELVPGQGHFGPDAIPGDARWRRGVRFCPMNPNARARRPRPAPARDSRVRPCNHFFRNRSRSRPRATAWSRSSALRCLSNTCLALPHGPWLTHCPFLVQAGPARPDGVLGALDADVKPPTPKPARRAHPERPTSASVQPCCECSCVVVQGVHPILINPSGGGKNPNIQPLVPSGTLVRYPVASKTITPAKDCKS